MKVTDADFKGNPLQVGDLVAYVGRTVRLRDAMGIVVRTPDQTNDDRFEVHWWKNNHQSKTMYCQGRVLELVKNESR